MKISVEHKSQKYAVQIKLEESETIDKYSYGVLINNNFEELADINQMQIDDNRMLIYSYPLEKPISEWLSKKHNEYDLISLLNSIIKAFETSENSGLLENCFLLNEKYIFVNDKKSSAKLIYIPISKYKSNEKPERIFRYIIDNIILDSVSDVLTNLKSSDCSIQSIKTIVEESSGMIKSNNVERVFVENKSANTNIAPISGKKDFVMDRKDIKSSVGVFQPRNELNADSVVAPAVKESVAPKADEKEKQAASRNMNIRPSFSGGAGAMEIPGGITVPGMDSSKEKSTKSAKKSKPQQKKSSHINLTEMVINMVKNAKEKRENEASEEEIAAVPEEKGMEVPGLSKLGIGNSSKNKKEKKKKNDKKSDSGKNARKMPGAPMTMPGQSGFDVPQGAQMQAPGNAASDYNMQAQKAEATRRAQGEQAARNAEAARRAQEEQAARNAEAARRAQEEQAHKAEAARRVQAEQPHKSEEARGTREAQAQRAEAARRAREAQAQKAEAARRAREAQAQKNGNNNVPSTNGAKNEVGVPSQKSQDIINQRNEMLKKAESEARKSSAQSGVKLDSDMIDVTRDETDGSLKIYVNISNELAQAGSPAKSNTEKNFANHLYPKIIRIKTNEASVVNKAVFKIGKEKGAVDYYVDNPVISRLHAMICCREGKYFIIDTKSTNKTFLNGNQCRSNYDYELSNGDIIKMANEEFKFEI